MEIEAQSMLVQFNETQVAVILRCLSYAEGSIPTLESLSRVEFMRKNIDTIRSLLANRLSIAVIDERLKT